MWLRKAVGDREAPREVGYRRRETPAEPAAPAGPETNSPIPHQTQGGLEFATGWLTAWRVYERLGWMRAHASMAALSHSRHFPDPFMISGSGKSR